MIQGLSNRQNPSRNGEYLTLDKRNQPKKKRLKMENCKYLFFLAKLDGFLIVIFYCKQ